MKINYVVTVWSGYRRFMDHKYALDKTFFLKKHIKRLEELDHNLNQITLAISYNPHSPENFDKYLNSLPKKIKNTPLVIFNRRNYGLSYGAISDVYNHYKNEFGFYITIEDDGFFVQNNFDAYLKNFLLNRPKCGYVCGHTNGDHATISCGMIRTKAMNDLYIINNNKLYPYPDKKIADVDSYNLVEFYGQMGMSRGIRKCGWTIEDVREDYQIGFRNLFGGYWGSHVHNEKKLVEPINGSYYDKVKFA